MPSESRRDSAATSPKSWVSSVSAALAVGLLNTVLTVSLAALVVADEPTRAHRLTRKALEQLTSDAPEVAAAFHELVVRSLAKRTGRPMRVVQALQG